MTTPHQAVSRANQGNSVIGWKLDRGQRADLLERLAPRYPNVVADHVTLAANVAGDAPLPDSVAAEALGRIDDEHGVEALVVAIDGRTERPDGGTYHITWSLTDGRDAHESNDVIATEGWKPIAPAVPVRLQPEHCGGALVEVGEHAVAVEVELPQGHLAGSSVSGMASRNRCHGRAASASLLSFASRPSASDQVMW